MRRTKFTEEQIIGVLNEAEAGAKTSDPARLNGVSEATIYNWKAKYGGLEVSEAKRLRSPEVENAVLKDRLARNGSVCRDAASGCPTGALSAQGVGAERQLGRSRPSGRGSGHNPFTDRVDHADACWQHARD
jgi:putative transposase